MRGGNWGSKLAVVTGASRGIGRALTLTLVRRGATALAVARSPEELAALERECHAALGTCHTLAVDLSDESGVSAVLAWLDARAATPDLLVNNAAVGHCSAIVETSWETSKKVIDTNFVAVVKLCQECGRRMSVVRRGTIVIVSSLAGRVHFPRLGIYTATKWALEGFALSLRDELAAMGVGVMLVRPGQTRSAGPTANDARSPWPG
jgi:short-subunit dehydrogenase